MKSQRFVDTLYSSHAIDRGLERGIGPNDVQSILNYGQRRRVFGDREICRIEPNPFLNLKRPDLARLSDIVVVLAPDSSVITVQRADHRFVEFAL